MKQSLPSGSLVTARLAEHRRHMAMKGQMHLESLAVTAARTPFEPLPKSKKKRRQR